MSFSKTIPVYVWIENNTESEKSSDNKNQPDI